MQHHPLLQFLPPTLSPSLSTMPVIRIAPEIIWATRILDHIQHRERLPNLPLR
jgi:hypothetical protein